MQAKRLHPAALLYFWYQSLKSGLLYFFILLAFNFNERFTGYFWLSLFAVLLLTVVGGILKYLRYSYELAAQEIILHSGVIFPKHLHISYAKIQTLQTKQWFYLRPFGLLSLQIETSSQAADEPEAVLPVISRAVVTQIQAKRDAVLKNDRQTEIFFPDRDSETEHIPASSEFSYQIKGHDLNLYALTSLGFLPLMLGFLAIYNRLSDVIPQKYINAAVKTLENRSGVVLSLLAIVVILLALGFSYLVVINRYFHFEVHPKEKQLVTSKGLLQQNIVTASQEKIQAVVISQSFLRQALKLATVQLVLASQVADEEQDDQLVLLPVLSQGLTLKNASRLVKWLPQKIPRLPVGRRFERWKIIRNILLPTILLVVIIGLFFQPYGWLSVVLLPVAFWIGYYASVNNRLALTNADVLLAQNGHLLTRKLYLIPRGRIQAMSMQQTVLMARVELSHLKIILRSGNEKQVVQVRYLPKKKAEEIYRWYRHK